MYSENNQQGIYQSVVCNFLSYVNLSSVTSFHMYFTGGGAGDKTEINSELLKYFNIKFMKKYE